MRVLVLTVLSFLFSFCISGQVKIEISDFGQFCPNTRDGHLISGDREFSGPVNHKISVVFSLSNDNKTIKSIVVLNMDERNSESKNETKIKAIWEKDIYEAPEGKYIKDFKLSGEENYSLYESISVDGFTGKSGSEVFWSCNDGKTYVRENKGFYFSFIADTGSDDISDDRDCRCDSRINSIKTDKKLIINLVNHKYGKVCKLKNLKFEKVLEASVVTKGKVQLWNNLGNSNKYVPNANNQKWQILHYEDGTVKLRNIHFNMVLEAAAGTTNKVQLWKDLGNKDIYVPNANNQKWKMIEFGENFKLENIHDFDSYLNSINGIKINVLATTSEGMKIDRWSFVDCDTLKIQ
ncbi:RICIN domain-containing protein [Aquimarina sp. Aq78]|uniref:RICIN domain-containing protein n=1 Tax=Aquimarina sp. Aq78 TaxID=1191889 RepID=UPI00131D4277|nr:RICIN domain-containing protein [Aquimarina sp. Aq78]